MNVKILDRDWDSSKTKIEGQVDDKNRNKTNKGLGETAS
jgi:hypothetical protein